MLRHRQGTLFIEKLVDEVLFESGLPRQHVSKETIGERRRGVERPHHFRLLNG